MTPVEGLGQAVAAVAAGLRQDRDALNILLRMSPDETVAVAAGMLDLVRLLAQIVAEREDASAAAVVAATAEGRSDLVRRTAAVAIEVIDTGADLPPDVDAAEIVVGLGATAGRLAEVAAEQVDRSALDILAGIGLRVAELEAFDPPD